MKLELSALRHSALPARDADLAEIADARRRPSIFAYDYLVLRALRDDVAELLRQVPPLAPGGLALDVGSESSPYRQLLEASRFQCRTLDIPGSKADFIGTAENTQLPDESFDLLICTQVLEHCDNPWKVLSEMHRIVRPGGSLILSAPHVWFFHPHPADHWRFTQQGIVRLCEDNGFRVRTLLSQGGSLAAGAQVANFLAFGVLGRLGRPLYAAMNVTGAMLDALVRNDLFCLNFACLAEKT